jgi:septation ring formation regulator EzrA
MKNQAGDELRDFGRKIEEKFNQTMPRVEEEVKKVITYLNDEVVPGVRKDSSKALRMASEQLAKLAERLEHGAGGR